MQNAAVALGKIGVPYELAYALPFGVHERRNHGRRVCGPQGRMPGRAVFRPVGIAAIKQASPGRFEALLLQQGFRGVLQRRGVRLRAQVQA
ncbi:hypothetical protein MyNCGM121_02630 [Achromobacter xylosoxidans]